MESSSNSKPTASKSQTGNIMMVPMTVPSMTSPYMHSGMMPYAQQMMVPVMVAGSSGDHAMKASSQQQPSNVMGNIESFFGGSFFAQKIASHMNEIESFLPQVETMDDSQILSEVSSLTNIKEDALLAEIKRDFGWGKEKLINEIRSYAQTHTKH